jgi:hypothetical protein
MTARDGESHQAEAPQMNRRSHYRTLGEREVGLR